MMHRQNFIRILAFLGLVVTGYLIYQHYKPSGAAFCNISDYVSCDVVNKSRYSEIFGIPVAIGGFAAYAVFLMASLRNFLQKYIVPLLVFAATALIFSLYLTFVEFFILKAVCILCVTQQIIIFLIFLTLFISWLQQKKSQAPSSCCF